MPAAHTPRLAIAAPGRPRQAATAPAMPHLLRSAVATALLTMAAGTTQAARIDYEAGVSVLHSDNIGLSDTNEISDWVTAPFLRFQVDQTGSTVRLQARGNVQYVDYSDDTYPSGFRGAFSGHLDWTVVPERLALVVEDYTSRQPIDSLAAFSPGNEQQTNVFIAGPTLFTRFSPTTRGQLDLRYSNTDAQDDDSFDGNRYTAAARVVHSLDGDDVLGGNLQVMKADFVLDPQLTNYTRYDAYASYTRNLRALKLTAEGGYSQIDFESARGTASSPLLRLTVDWNPSPRSNLQGIVRVQFADAAEDLTLEVLPPLAAPVVAIDSGTASTPVSPDVYRERRLEVGYTFTGERLVFSARPYYQRIHYLDGIGQDQSEWGGAIEAGYTLRPRLVLSARYAQDDTDYAGLVRTDRDKLASVFLTNQFTRHWSGRIDLQRRKRDSTAPGQSYVENAAIVSVAWRR